MGYVISMLIIGILAVFSVFWIFDDKKNNIIKSNL